MNIERMEIILTNVLNRIKLEYTERLDLILLWRLKYSDIVSAITVNNIIGI